MDGRENNAFIQSHSGHRAIERNATEGETMTSQAEAYRKLWRLHTRFSTWREVASHIGYSPSVISVWKNKKEPISVAGIIRIDEVMNGKSYKQIDRQPETM